MTFNWLHDNGRKRGKNGHSVRQPLTGHALIELHGVQKAYFSDAGQFMALKGVDLQIHVSEYVAVVGKSGSGKSTLINMITGIDRPTSGAVIVAGTPIHELGEGPMAEWRGRQMGIVFQFFQLLPTLTVLENVMIPMDLVGRYQPEERHSRALHLLEGVGLADEAQRFPAALSGGQQQLAAIARALANDPPILVADEPTGNLDTRAAEVVFNLFESLVEAGKTVLVVTHDEELARRALRKVTLVDGEILGGKKGDA
jgi:putative ABC transport system ATP-binding protein